VTLGTQDTGLGKQDTGLGKQDTGWRQQQVTHLVKPRWTSLYTNTINMASAHLQTTGGQCKKLPDKRQIAVEAW